MTIAVTERPSEVPGSGAAQECAAIAADLERLKDLITDAGDRLLASFSAVADTLPRMHCTPEERSQLGGVVAAAVTALQFQDIATQLTSHAQRRLDALCGLLGEASGDAACGPGLLPTDKHPVGQAEMSAGSIDLF